MKDPLEEVMDNFPKGTKLIGGFIVVTVGAIIVIGRMLIGKR